MERPRQPREPFDPLAEARRLLEGARASRAPDGFGELDQHGRLGVQDRTGAVVTARMTYCFSLAQLLGWSGFEELAEHGVAALWGRFRDPTYGGFHTFVPADDSGAEKAAYPHMFVLLAAATAAGADVPGAQRLLDYTLDLVEARFWSDDDQAMIESWDRGFTTSEPYWGANANMHAVEALMAAFVCTGDARWRDRATAIGATFVDGHARRNAWLLPEHYRSDWTVDLDYHRDQPSHEFRPYGVTIGHLFEWSRLLLEIDSSYVSAPGWLREASGELFDTAIRLGWTVDHEPGFVYTVDWNGEPVVHQRLHWVVAEAIGAAASWHDIDPARGAADRLTDWLDYADRYLIDRVDGSWHHELDRQNRPAATIMRGKPDIYHALQACLFTTLPVAPSTAARIGGQIRSRRRNDLQ